MGTSIAAIMLLVLGHFAHPAPSFSLTASATPARQEKKDKEDKQEKKDKQERKDQEKREKESKEDEVWIKRVLTAKEELKYKVEGGLKQTITLPDGMTSEMSTELAAELLFKFGEKSEDCGLPFTLTVGKLKLLSSPPQPGDSKNRTVTLKGVVDEQNEISDVSLQGTRRDDLAIAGLVSRMAQGAGTFPDRALKPGETWTVTEQQSFLGGKKLEYTLKFEGQEVVEKVTLYHITADTEVPVEVGLGMDDENEKTGIAMKGTVHIIVDAYIDQNGLMHSLMFQTKADVTLDSPDAGGQMKIQSDEVLKISRQI